MEAFLRGYRLEAAEREALQAAPELRPAARGGGGALRSRPGPPGGPRRRGARGLPLRRGGAQRGADPLRGQPPGAAADRHRRGPAPADRRRASLAQAAVRPRGGVLASGVRLPARNRAAAGRARPALLLHRPERPRAPERIAGAGAGRGRDGRVHARPGGRGSGLVAARLPVRSRLRRFPPPLDGGNAPLVDRRRPVRPRGGAGSRREPRGGVRRRRGPAASGSFASGAESPAWSPSRSIPSCSATGGRRARSGSGRCCASSASAAFGCSPSPRPWSATSRRSGRCGSRAGARAGTFAPGTRPRSPISPGRRGAWSSAWWPRSAPRR